LTSAVPIVNLTEAQKKAVYHKNGPLLVLAGPGSGKTRVITCRIAALIEAGVAGRHICAITFTNKAAEEMRLRVQQFVPAAGAHISTFHSLCVWILRRYAEYAGIKPNFSIFDVPDQQRCMKEAIKECSVDAANFTPSRMIDYISRLKNDLEDVETFEARAGDYFEKNTAKIYRQYQRILALNNALDFDDLLIRTAMLLRDWPEIRLQLSERFRYLLVDEYQDTNHAQYQIAKGIALAHRNICVTGDPDQSIYRWRGADIENILAFEKDWPEAAVVKLEENFRSTPNILKTADKLIAHNTKRKSKVLIPTRSDGDEVVIQTCDDEAQEAVWVAQTIENLIRNGTDPNEIAVFYRVNAMSRAIEEAFVSRQLPYQMVRGIEFYARKEIRDLLSYLKLIVNPADDVAFNRAIATHPRGIGKTSIENLGIYARRHGLSLLEAAEKADQIDTISRPTRMRLIEFAAMIRRFQQEASGGIAPLMDCVFVESGLADALKSDPDAVENINGLVNAAAEYEQQTEQPSLTDYLQMIALYSDVDAYNADSGKVSLMTLHAAKGLEFDCVFIIGLEEGILPHERSSWGGIDDLEEERRLFFVGITRARIKLIITYARHRVMRGQFVRNTPSQFLYEIGFKGESLDAGWETAGQEDELIACPAAEKKRSAYAFEVNELVEHAKFGIGRVKEFLDLGQDSIVVVKFNSGNTKSLMVKYAKLQRIGR